MSGGQHMLIKVEKISTKGIMFSVLCGSLSLDTDGLGIRLIYLPRSLISRGNTVNNLSKIFLTDSQEKAVIIQVKYREYKLYLSEIIYTSTKTESYVESNQINRTTNNLSINYDRCGYYPDSCRCNLEPHQSK